MKFYQTTEQQQTDISFGPDHLKSSDITIDWTRQFISNNLKRILKMTQEKRMFIVLDGPDGTGKSTQVKLLKSRLEQDGYSVLTTREPGGTNCPGAEEIRDLLVNGPADRWDMISELFLFSAARRNHVETVIKPALAEGKIVICDRFVGSTMAYQGYGRGLDLTLIEQVTRIVLGDFKPDLGIFLAISPEEGLRRAAQRRGKEMRFESMDMDFHDRVSAGYESLGYRTDLLGKMCYTIDTTQDYSKESANDCIDRVTANIYSIITYILLSYDGILDRVIPKEI